MCLTSSSIRTFWRLPFVQLEVVVQAGTRLVTFNVRHFKGAERFGMETMKAGEPLGIAKMAQMTTSVHVPEDLYRLAADLAAAENRSVDELLTSALEERLLGLERLKERASRGSYEKFL